MKNKKIVLGKAGLFIILMGIVSMLCDMCHEGAKSGYGVFLPLTGASAATVSMISGLAQFIGCSLVLITGFIANKTKKFWTMTIIGYSMTLFAIPALALTSKNGWIYACAIILVERIGRAIRKPAKSTLVSFASKKLGEGKTFAFVEFLDQIGAFIGPLILSATLLISKSNSTYKSYLLAFLVLGIPALFTLIMLLYAKKKFPNPEELEEEQVIDNNSKTKLLTKRFMLYLIAICFLAFGFIDFPLITMRIGSLNLVKEEYLPLFYSFAMLADAFSALFFGYLYDKFGIKVLAISTFISMLFPFLVLLTSNLIGVLVGILFWGIGMGAQESILKSAVATIVSKDNRALGYGVFEFFFGLFWFLGSLVIGLCYEKSLIYPVIISSAFQLSAIIFFILSSNKKYDLK